MKSFLVGLLVFIFYAVLCIGLLSYTMGDTYTFGSDALNQSNEELSDVGIATDLSFEDSTNLGETSTEDMSDIQLESTDSLNNSTDNSTGLELDDLNDTNQDGDNLNAKNINRPAVTFNISLPDNSKLIDCSAFSVVFQDQARVKIPYSCREYGISIKSFLDKNPGSTLKITGYTDPIESPNTGTGRAGYLKNLLTNTGIPADRIIATSAVNNLNFSSGSANGGVAMEINGRISSNSSSTDLTENSTPSSTDGAKETKPVLASKKFTSGFQGKYFYGDQKFTSYSTTIKKLLSENPGSKVYAYSYTDNEGDANDNYAISRDNAGTVRKILLQSGISSNRIQSVARGEQNAGGSGNNLSVILVIK